jgi:hypothetical protein
MDKQNIATSSSIDKEVGNKDEMKHRKSICSKCNDLNCFCYTKYENGDTILIF